MNKMRSPIRNKNHKKNRNLRALKYNDWNKEFNRELQYHNNHTEESEPRGKDI